MTLSKKGRKVFTAPLPGSNSSGAQYVNSWPLLHRTKHFGDKILKFPYTKNVKNQYQMKRGIPPPVRNERNVWETLMETHADRTMVVRLPASQGPAGPVSL